MDSGGSIKSPSQPALEILSDQLVDHFASPRMVVFVIPDRRSRDTPDVAVAAIFSPAGFIGLHGGAGANFCFEGTEQRLCILLDPVQEFHQFSKAHFQTVPSPPPRPQVAS